MGTFTFMWRNDAALAERQVAELMKKRAELQERARTLATRSDVAQEELQQEEERNCEAIIMATSAADQAEQDLKNSKNKAASLQERYESTNGRLEDLLGKQVRAEHLLKASKAYVAFGQSAMHDASVAENVMADWVNRLEPYVDLCKIISEADTLHEQRLLTRKLRELVASNRVPLLSLVRAAGPLPSLALPAVLPEELRRYLEDEQPCLQAAQVPVLTDGAQAGLCDKPV